ALRQAGRRDGPVKGQENVALTKPCIFKQKSTLEPSRDTLAMVSRCGSAIHRVVCKAGRSADPRFGLSIRLCECGRCVPQVLRVGLSRASRWSWLSRWRVGAL